MLSRRVSLVVAGLVLAGLTGCTPTPAPTPTPTGFASEDEAFAAAKETYRAYTTAVDAYYGGDREADPLRYLTHDALSAEKEAQAVFEEEGLRSEGTSRVSSFIAESTTVISGAAEVQAVACVDTSDRQIFDSEGNLLNADADPLIAQEVTLVSIDGEMRISSATQVDAAVSC